MLDNISRLSNAVSRSISAENYKGEKGKAGMSATGTGQNCARDLGIGWKVSPSVNIKAHTTFEVADIDGPGAIKHIWMTDSASMNRAMIIRIYWEGNDKPSVEAPLGDFFASADCQQFSQLSSLAVCVNPRRAFNCYWTMPFKKHCRITVENIRDMDITLYYQVDYVLTEVPDDSAYFHAQFRRTNPLPYKEVYTLLDNVCGKGQYVGTYMFWGVNNNGWWGEGEIKFYLDGDKEFPTICGTGTEDYFCGSYDFDVDGHYVEFNTPYCGLSKVMRPDGLYKSQQRFSLYRWHITDPIYFSEDIKVTIQALGWRSGGRYLPLQDDISSVAYWYLDTPYTNFPELPDSDYLELV
ncbi:MAG: DUF2961 domain-containing protein [Oscillospiraceae bacterium]|nr:DUF2961 domain-containing protein [Oscillospiraceae bacterium]